MNRQTHKQILLLLNKDYILDTKVLTRVKENAEPPAKEVEIKKPDEKPSDAVCNAMGQVKKKHV